MIIFAPSGLCFVVCSVHTGWPFHFLFETNVIFLIFLYSVPFFFVASQSTLCVYCWFAPISNDSRIFWKPSYFPVVSFMSIYLAECRISRSPSKVSPSLSLSKSSSNPVCTSALCVLSCINVVSHTVSFSPNRHSSVWTPVPDLLWCLGLPEVLHADC